MSIGTPALIGSGASTGSDGSLTFGVTAAVAAGSSVVIAVDLVRNASTGLGATDSKGNTYTVNVTKFGTSDLLGAILSAHNVAALTTSDTITVTYPNAFYEKRVQAYSVTGLAASSTLDKTASNNANSSAWSSGSTGTLSQADEIAFAFGVLGTTAASNPDAGWTELFDFSNTSLNRLVFQYQIVSATTALNGGGSFAGGSVPWAGMIATYKAAAPASDTATMGVATGSGISPTASIAAAQGVATGSGITASSAASAPQGVATGTGITPSSSTAEATTPGLAVGSGVAPVGSTAAPVTSGTATGAGAGPSASTVESVTPGVATGSGIAPTSTSSNAAATPGVAVGAGISPTAGTTAPLTSGSASGSGISPGASALAGYGTATGAGTAPSASAAVTPGSAVGQGIGPAASTTVLPGLAVGQGVTAGSLTVITVTPGLAVGAGIAPMALRQAVRYRLTSGARTSDSTLEPSTRPGHTLEVT
jgi:hypothetical protein